MVIYWNDSCSFKKVEQFSVSQFFKFREEYMKAQVDANTCIGCELCPTICPEVFKMGDDGIAHTIADLVPSDVEDTAREAAESCPVDAISIKE